MDNGRLGFLGRCWEMSTLDCVKLWLSTVNTLGRKTVTKWFGSNKLENLDKVDLEVFLVSEILSGDANSLKK